ncbi:MAG: methionyl-tRNA formyltransferase [Candidatus Levybacteria bacterium]|nr:methionyl-tRNA formyltransferase [Candidatus Levybacteria bacterium]
MKQSIPVVFFGSDKFVLPIVEVLSKNFDLSLILTTEHDPHGPVTSFAKQNNIKLVDVKKFDQNLKSLILNHKSDFAVLAYFGLILSKQILNIFPKGIINIHPSLLPKYRGPTPGQAAILAGDKETGVTIIKLDQEVDHGPILAQEKTKIEETDTAESLYDRLFKQGAKLLAQTLPDYLSDKLQLQEQNHEKATFTDQLNRQSGYIDPKKFQISNFKFQIESMIRAYYPWPGVWTHLRLRSGGQAKIVKFLPNGKIQVEGKKPMSYKDFLNGYPEIKDKIHLLISEDTA